MFDSEHPDSLLKLQYLDDTSRCHKREAIEEVSVKIQPKFLTQMKNQMQREGGNAHFEAKLEPVTGLTPDPDSVLSEGGRDTPDSSIKEEPSEEASEGGVLVCRWKNCGREFLEQINLVSHILESHVDQKKGCEDFPCMWEVSGDGGVIGSL